MPCPNCGSTHDEVTQPSIAVPTDLVSALADAAVAGLHELRQELEKLGLEKPARVCGAIIHETDELVEMVREARVS